MRLVVIGGSDAGISAALRARECDPAVEVQMIVADAYPNFSICGIPYHVSGEVPDWHSLAHRTTDAIEAAGIRLRLNERALAIDPARRTVTTTSGSGRTEQTPYDQVVIATGAVPALPPIDGLGELGPGERVHVLHSMDDTFLLNEDLEGAGTVAIIGAGYIGLEMAEALTHRGIAVTVLEALPQVLPRTLEPPLAEEVEAALASHRVQVITGTTVDAVSRKDGGLVLTNARGLSHHTDVVLVATGVRPATTLGTAVGLPTGAAGALVVDRQMRTGLPNVFAAGDCVHTHHALLPEPTYAPLGTTAHKQGRIAGENAVGGRREFAGSVGTQVVRVFDRVVAATGLGDTAAGRAGYHPVTNDTTADDHKAYYPGATPIRIRLTGDARTRRLLGAQLVGHIGAEIAKRVDIFATAIQRGLTVDELNDLDLSYTPPLGSPWDAVQLAAQAWSTTLAQQAGRIKA